MIESGASMSKGKRQRGCVDFSTPLSYFEILRVLSD